MTGLLAGLRWLFARSGPTSLFFMAGFLTGIGGTPASWGHTILASFCSTEDDKAAVTTGGGWLSLDDEAGESSGVLNSSTATGASSFLLTKLCPLTRRFRSGFGSSSF